MHSALHLLPALPPLRPLHQKASSLVMMAHRFLFIGGELSLFVSNYPKIPRSFGVPKEIQAVPQQLGWGWKSSNPGGPLCAEESQPRGSSADASAAAAAAAEAAQTAWESQPSVSQAGGSG